MTGNLNLCILRIRISAHYNILVLIIRYVLIKCVRNISTIERWEKKHNQKKKRIIDSVKNTQWCHGKEMYEQAHYQTTLTNYIHEGGEEVFKRIILHGHWDDIRLFRRSRSSKTAAKLDLRRKLITRSALSFRRPVLLNVFTRNNHHVTRTIHTHDSYDMHCLLFERTDCKYKYKDGVDWPSSNPGLG